MADYNNEQDLTGAIIAKLKQIFGNRTALIAIAVVLAAIAVIIFAAAMLSGGSGEEFEALSALTQHLDSGKDKTINFNKKGLNVTMRISDICSVDEDSGEMYTSLYYADEYDKKYVFADYIIKNMSSKPVTVNCGSGSDDSLDLYIGYFYDKSDEWENDDENDFCAAYQLYDNALGDVVPNTEIVIGSKETKKFTLRYIIRSSSINECSGVYFCEKCKDTDEFTKYYVMGVGKPKISHEFKNSDLFPQIIRDEKAASSKPAETAAPKSEEVNETTATLKYLMKKIDSDSHVFSMINNGGNPYNLSVEIAAAGNAESNLTVEASGYSAFIENESIQGTIVELAYTDGLEVEKVKLMFEIKESAIENTLGKYTDNSDEFKGIKRFNVFMYDEELNMQLPIETKFDLENNIVYAETDRCGTYALVDMEIWVDMLTNS